MKMREYTLGFNCKVIPFYVSRKSQKVIPSHFQVKLRLVGENAGSHTEERSTPVATLNGLVLMVMELS